MSPKTKRAIRRISTAIYIVVNFFLWFITLFFLTVNLSMVITTRKTGVPSAFGYSVIKIETGSMVDAGFDVKSFVLIGKCNPKKLQKGDYIAFYYYSTPGAAYPDEVTADNRPTDVSKLKGKSIVFHEVVNFVEKDGHRWFVTKGSNNQLADDIWIYDDYVIGQYKNIGTVGNRLLNFFMSPRGRVLLVVIPAAFIIALNSYQMFLIISEMRAINKEGLSE